MASASGTSLFSPEKAVDPDPLNPAHAGAAGCLATSPPSDQRWPNNNSESPRANAGRDPTRPAPRCAPDTVSLERFACRRARDVDTEPGISFDGETGAAIVLETRSSPETADLLDRRLAIQSLEFVDADNKPTIVG